MSSHRQRDISEEPSSPDDGSNFRRSLQIDMKGLVGSAVGNVSLDASYLVTFRSFLCRRPANDADILAR